MKNGVEWADVEGGLKGVGALRWCLGAERGHICMDGAGSQNRGEVLDFRLDVEGCRYLQSTAFLRRGILVVTITASFSREENSSAYLQALCYDLTNLSVAL